MDLFDQVNSEGMTVVTVTHDAEVAARSARIIRLNDGRIEDQAA
jgi:putative ABC transport system ATP-binding protein